jgi:hypothetical protein
MTAAEREVKGPAFVVAKHMGPQREADSVKGKKEPAANADEIHILDDEDL